MKITTLVTVASAVLAGAMDIRATISETAKTTTFTETIPVVPTTGILPNATTITTSPHNTTVIATTPAPVPSPPRTAGAAAAEAGGFLVGLVGAAALAFAL